MSSYTAGTFSIKLKDVKKKWLLIDAEGLALGRLAARVALILRGKDKPNFTPHVDCGDNVVVVNAQKVKITGKKLKDHKFFWHTGHPGGIKERSVGDILYGRFPERVLIKAVERMLPKDSTLARRQLKNLYVYAHTEHPHSGQQPESYQIYTKAAHKTASLTK